MDQYLDIAKEYYDKAVKAVSKTETEKKMANALSRHNWGASSTELREIARLTHDWTEYAVVMREIWTTMQLTGARWRQIFKSLTLLEYLIKNGADRVIQEARDKIYHIKTLQGFNHYAEGVDKGAGIREKAKELVELLNDKDRIKEEREKAMALRDKYTGMGRDGMPSASSNGYDGGSYDSGGYGGRYSNQTTGALQEKPWDKGFSKDKEEEDDDDDFNPREESTSKARNELTFDDEDDEEEQQPAGRRGKRKGKKGKLKIKIRSAAKADTVRSSSKPQASEDLLFGDMQSGQTNSGGDVDLFGQDHQQQQPKPTESNETFDPFGSGGGQAQGDDDDEDWAGFESAKPTSAAKPEVDLFGQISSQPQPQSGAQQAGFDAFQSPAQPQNSGGNAVDLLGAAPMQAAPSGMGGLDLLSATPPQPAPSSMPLNQQMLYTGSSAPVQQTTTAAPQQAQQGGSAKGDALWGSGLVDLGNLSLNSSKPSGSVPQMQTQPHAQLQGKAPMGQPMMQFHQPMAPTQGMAPMQPMGQQMRQMGLPGQGMMNTNVMQPNRMAGNNMQGGFPTNTQQSFANGKNQNALDDLFQ